MAVKMDFYLYVTSDTSNDYFANTPSEFMIEAPYRIQNLSGQWECALVEVSLDCQFTPKVDRLYLCGDFLGESFIDGRSAQVLRNLEVRGTYKRYLNERYSDRIYVDVIPGHKSKFRFSLMGEDLNKVEFQSNKLHVVLHFRQKLCT